MRYVSIFYFAFEFMLWLSVKNTALCVYSCFVLFNFFHLSLESNKKAKFFKGNGLQFNELRLLTAR
jgi:hypothetical protein